VSFRAKSIDEVIRFSIRGITSILKLLSGFLTTLAKLVKDQDLIKPFGSLNHKVSEKPLPAIPAKRPNTA
jgi:hypothetical protein